MIEKIGGGTTTRIAGPLYQLETVYRIESEVSSSGEKERNSGKFLIKKRIPPARTL